MMATRVQMGLHLPEHVAAQEDRATLGGEPGHQVAHLDDAERVEAVGRLVQHQEVGVV